MNVSARHQQNLWLSTQELMGISLLSGIGACIATPPQVLAFYLGGLSHALPQLMLAIIMAKCSDLLQPTLHLTIFFGGAALKLFLSIVCVLFVVQHLRDSLLCVFLGYLVAIILFWISSFCWLIRMSKPSNNAQS